MLKHIIIEKHKAVRIVSIESQDLVLQIKEIPKRDWLEADFLVELSASAKPFEFSEKDKAFYFYTSNEEKTDEQSAEHLKIIEWLSEEEASKALEGKYIEYVDQRKYILIHNGKNVAEKVIDLLQNYS